MKYPEFLDWVKSQGKTEADLQKYVWMEAAEYFNDLSVYELYTELVEGEGKLLAMNMVQWADYFDDCEDAYQETIKEYILKFWAERRM